MLQGPKLAYRLMGEEGKGTYGKATVASALIIGGDTYNYVMSFLTAKKTEAKEVMKEKTSA